MSIPSRSQRLESSIHLTANNTETSEPTMQPLTIMSYNVNFGGVNYDGTQSKQGQRVLQAIKENGNVDLVCLQETHIGWEIAVSNSDTLSTLYPNQVWDHTKTNVYLASGSAVMAKSHLNLQVEMLMSNVEGSYFNAMHIIVTHQNNDPNFCKYQVLNLHLRPPLSFEGGNMQHVSAYLYQTVNVRKNEVNSYVEQALQKCSYPLIILGDFNESSQSGLILSNYASLLKEKGYHDFVENQTTWYWPLKGPLSLWGSYDHIFARKDQFEIVFNQVLSEYKEMASDHLPCIVSLKPKSSKLLN